jgi:hypothetical protein
MTLKLNRRSFLLSLIALGAHYTLSSDATAKEVNQVWKEAQAQPWYFEVDDYGTITEPDYPQNETWGDIFSISSSYLKTPEDVISEVRGCQLLNNHFGVLAEDELETLIDELDRIEPLAIARRRHIKKLIAALQADSYEGWVDWVRLEGKAGVERFKKEIANWAAEPADYSQSDWFPPNYGPQGQAKSFFESLGRDTRQALGVVIVEGEHPGSTYYAAELRNDIEAANETAVDLGLPFRFKGEGA